MNPTTPTHQVSDINQLAAMQMLFPFKYQTAKATQTSVTQTAITQIPATRIPNPSVIPAQTREDLQTETIPTMFNTNNNGFTVPVSKVRPFQLEAGEMVSSLKVNRQDKYSWISETKKKQDKLPHFVSDYIVIGIISEKINEKIAVVNITSEADSGIGSINDPRMGIVPPNNICSLCRLGLESCPGHFGRIKLTSPIYHPLFINEVEDVLTCVCKDCGNLLLTAEQVEYAGLNRLAGLEKLRAMALYCQKKAKDLVCPNTRNIGQKKTCLPGIEVGPEIRCSKNPVFDSKTKDRDMGKIMMKSLNNSSIELYVEDAFCTLDMISDSDARLMGFDIDSHPRDLIVFSILVIPPAFRGASTAVPGSFAVDGFGNIYREIIKLNNQLTTAKKDDKLEDLRTSLYQKFKSLLNDTVDKSKNKQARFTGLMSVFQTKKGILRLLALGKRVDFTARTVIGPNPFLTIDQVGVPRIWAPHLTVPITVTTFNKKALTVLLEKGKITSIVYGRGKGHRVIINEQNRSKTTLEVGQVCERWLRNGDYITLGRQPSIHKQNIMGLEVVLIDALNLQLNPSYVEPYNADFDGDEMNIHVGQTTKARAEIEILMALKHCMMNEQMNSPMIGLILSDITAAYVLTSENPDIPVDVWFSAMNLIQEKSQLATFDDRLSYAGLKRLSGRALFSMLLPADFYYQKEDVLIENGILINGSITKKDIGRGRNSIIQVMWMNYGYERTTIFLTDTSRVLNRWFSSYGFSIGLESCTHTDPKVMELKEQQMALVKMMVMQAGAKLSDPIEEEKRQREIVAFLRQPSNLSQKVLKETFGFDNALARMIISGSKGTPFNLGQIVFALGLQLTGGKPIPLSMTNQTRLLPTQDPDDPDPITYSYIQNSFSQGLTPEENFIHSIPARDTMLDTALKTADVGKMSREITLSMASYTIQYDGSVRNPQGQILQPAYGYDGMNPGGLTLLKMNGDDLPFFMNIANEFKMLNAEYGYVPFAQFTPEEPEIEPVYVGVTDNYQIQHIIDNGGSRRLENYLRKYIKDPNQVKELLRTYTDDPSFYQALVASVPKETEEEKRDRSSNRDQKRALEYRDYFINLTQINERFNDLRPEDAYLDFGAGTGVFGWFFGLALGFDDHNIFGTDIQWREAYKMINTDINFVPLEPGKKLQFEDNQFGVISSMMTFHHVNNLDFVLKELNRVMRPEGYLVLREHDAENDIDKLIIDVEHMIYDNFDDEYTDEKRQLYYGQYVSKEAWSTKLKEFGFTRVGDGDEFLYKNIRAETKPFYAVYQKK